MNKYVLTTNLSPQLYIWLDERAKTKFISKRATIETALEKLRIEEKKRAMTEGYLDVMKDTVYMKEMIDMAEDGLVEWGKELAKIDGEHLSKRNIPRKPRSSGGK
ncbi:MAG: hypothetical protein COV07_03590 [Candidatus Vogelbacteria bacterium CG10_big_fil_rev_8_21_14_0_10_45_14]|uniref:Uncharacterized protein n=1 Tax=Candidatus Vogelbacteria bacterium CG10_big_fil_rev_8_21_14_0_10_45_14 TaxID=1975042 RepID=A0A2H0RJ27_9BACT|nr:MAG: hypothetical protein COV07_03590 [Candidatus Vogelbacteria bacterium CG10_big_fil_rev_8_21_14_0_10_45_14]